MDWNSILLFIGENLEIFLAIVTILSFIGNIVQRKTNHDAQYFFESIFKACNRTRGDHITKKEKSVEELLSVILLVRTQAESGLRLLGSSPDYEKSSLYVFSRNIYRLLFTIRKKFPMLISGENKPIH